MCRKVLELDSKVLEIAKELYEKRSLLIMGRGFNFATCLEGALKVNPRFISCQSRGIAELTLNLLHS
jgi:glutamine---fructose-6-phosphate transaminase (isomerizing)